MNKEQLNNAFKSMTPTERQKKEMLENILSRNGRSAKHKAYTFKKHSNKYIYTFSATAAAFALMIGVVKMYPVMQNNLRGEVQIDAVTQQVQKKAEVKPNTNYNDIKDIQADNKEKDDMSLAHKDVLTQNNNAASETKKLERSSNSTSQTNKSDAKDEIVSDKKTNCAEQKNADESTNDNEINNESEENGIMAFSAESADTEVDSYGLDGGDLYSASDSTVSEKAIAGSSMPRVKVSGTIECTKDEFLKLLGKNIGDYLKIPSDMRDLTMQSKIFVSQESIVYDGWVFEYYSSQSRYMSVVVSKNIDLYHELTAQYKSQITSSADTEYVLIAGADKNYTLYATDGSICFTVNFCGVTKNEINDFINSITQIK